MYKQWADGAIIVIPAIIDYEVRRELNRKRSSDALKRLDLLYARFVRYLPISQAAMNRAAGLWAEARMPGRANPTADDRGLDGDVILSAQALEFCSDSDDWQIVTENVDHIARYVGERAQSRRDVVNHWLNSRGSILS